MKPSWWGKHRPLITAVVILSCFSTPTHGQFNSVLSAIFGGGSSTPSTPASPTVISMPAATSPTPTPASTPAATPAATRTATPTSTPAAVEEATPATPAVAAAPADTTAATAAAPDATPAATPRGRATPTPTVKPATPPSPPPPAPVVIDQAKLVPALPADQTVSAPTTAPAPAGAGITNPQITAVDVRTLAELSLAQRPLKSAGREASALQAVVKISGPGVTPFVIPQQTVLLRSMASVLTTVSLNDLRIRYVTSAANSRRRLLSEAEVQVASRRGLLDSSSSSAESAAAADGQLYNVASVTVEANCTNNNGVAATLTEMQSVISNDLLTSAMQAYGQPQWGVQMLSITAVNPNVPLAASATCRKNFGSLCLDKTSLSVAAVEVIIAIGAVVLVMILAIPCVVLEWRRKSGQAAELDPTPETPKSPLARVQHMYNKLIDSVKAASPMHRRGGSNSRSAFRSDTPVAANADKEQGGAIHINATPA